jgi:hypothetical protein
MPTEFQFRRYSAADIATKTGKEGEIFIDTDNWILKIQDGVTAGGQSASVVANVPFSNVTGAVSTNTNLQTALDAKIDNDFAASLSTTTVGGLSGTTYLIVQDSVDTYKIDYTVLLTPYADAIATNTSLNSVSLKTSSSAEISGLTEKGTPVSADVLLIEDSADSFSKKYVQIGNLPGGGGGGSGTVTSVAVSGSDGIEVDSGSPITTSGTIALGIDASTLLSHISVESGADVTDETNVKSAIDGMTLTDIGTPASTDRVLIQDADDSNNLKYADFSEFGGGGGGLSNVVEDTTPQLGGNLDLNSNDITGTGNIDITAGNLTLTDGTVSIAATGLAANASQFTISNDTNGTVFEVDEDGHVYSVAGFFTKEPNTNSDESGMSFPNPNDTRIQTLGSEFLRFEASPLPYATTFNAGKRDTDFYIYSDVNADTPFFMQGSDGYIGIHQPSPTEYFHVGTDALVDGNITTSTPTANGHAATKQYVDDHQAAITAITLTIDGGGSAITTGNTGKYPTVPYSGTIQSVEIAADQSGSIVVDVWKAAGAIPTNSNSITASAPPTLSSAQRATDSTLTGWTTAISAGDVLGFEVDSATTVTSVVLTIKVKKA